MDVAQPHSDRFMDEREYRRNRSGNHSQDEGMILNYERQRYNGVRPKFSDEGSLIPLEYQLEEESELYSLFGSSGLEKNETEQLTSALEPEQSDVVAVNYGSQSSGIALSHKSDETTQAEAEVAQEVLAGALMGDFNDDPTFWSDIGQIVAGLIPIAGQLGDARDLIHALDDIFNKEGFKKIASWATLVLIVIGFIPGVGDAIKSIGRRGIRYLDNSGIIKRIGQWLGNNVISPILDLVEDITAPLVAQIKYAIRRKLDEAQEIARQLSEGVDDVIGQPNLATEGADNVPSRMKTGQPGRGNEQLRMEGNQTSGNLPRNTHLNVLRDLGARTGEELIEVSVGRTAFEAFENAREMARVRANLSDDAVPFLQEIGPHSNNVYTGIQSPDGLSGWRIDFDPQNPEKGFHVNWWFREGPKRRDGWYSGAITIEGGTQQDYWEILNHFPRRENLIGE